MEVGTPVSRFCNMLKLENWLVLPVLRFVLFRLRRERAHILTVAPSGFDGLSTSSCLLKLPAVSSPTMSEVVFLSLLHLQSL
jgi:hypothetical protein